VAPAALAQEAPATDLEGRRSIRGGPVEPRPNESPELFELRRFEEGTFPRSGFVPPPDADAEGSEPSVDREDLKDIPEKLRAHRPLRPVSREDASASAAPTAGVGGLDPAFLKTLRLPDLPVRWDQRLLRYLAFYRSDPKGRAIMTSWLKKQGRWRALM